MILLFLCEELSSGPCLGLRSSLVFKLVFHPFPYLTSLIGWRSSPLFEPLPNWPFKFSQMFHFLSSSRSLPQAAGFLFILIPISLPQARTPGNFNCAWDLVYNASVSFHTQVKSCCVNLSSSCPSFQGQWLHLARIPRFSLPLWLSSFTSQALPLPSTWTLNLILDAFFAMTSQGHCNSRNTKPPGLVWASKDAPIKTLLL